MMLVYILDIHAQYGAVNLFIEDLAQGFRDLGHQAEIKDIKNFPGEYNEQGQIVFSRKHVQEMLTPMCDVMVAFNAQGEGLIDYLGSKPFVGMLVDHPYLYVNNFQPQWSDKVILTGVDRQHVKYMQKVKPSFKSYFVPHGGSRGGDCERPFDKRDIDILFTGSYAGSYKALEKEWAEKYDKTRNTFLNYCTHHLKKHPLDSYWDVFTALIKVSGNQPNDGLVQAFFELAKPLDWYVRSYWRYLCLESLDKAGIAVDLYGQGWEHAGFKNHRVCGSVDYSEALNLMSRSKCVLHVGPHFTDGAHERIFSGMLNGAVVIADETHYCREVFEDEQHLCFYSLERLRELPEIVKNVVNNKEKWDKISQQGRLLAQEKHTWKNRVQDILNICAI